MIGGFYHIWTGPRWLFSHFSKCFPQNSASQSKKLCTHCPHFVPLFLSKSVLPCAVLCPHHVHQLGAERKRLCHSIQWVSQTAWKTFQWISWQERNVSCVCVISLISLGVSPIRDDGGGSGNCSWYSHPGADRGHGECALPTRTRRHHSQPEQLLKTPQCLRACHFPGAHGKHTHTH